MTRVYIGVGANIAPERNIHAALLLLQAATPIVGISTFYRTAPLGHSDQPDYYNGVVEIETALSPHELKYGVLRHIEQALGRQRGEDTYAARTMDLDILLYDEARIREDGLLIPALEIFDRPFLARSLAELAPNLIVPGTGKRLREVAARFAEVELQPLGEYTQELKEALLHEPDTC